MGRFSNLSPQPTPQKLSDRVFNSAALMVVANIVKRSIGIVSMLILARLLTPDDYGLVALSMLVIHFFDLFSQFGVNQYVLSRVSLKDDELQTAWTLRLFVRLGLAVCVWFLAPRLAQFFERDELHAVLLVSALVPVLSALEGPGLLLLRRAMTYRRIALISVGAKLAGFVTAVSIAVQFRTYWALVVGDVVVAGVYSFLSYKAHSLRPRICLKNLSAQWSFSKWIFTRGLFGYSRGKIDNFVIGRFLGVTELGLYSMAKQLATMPHDLLTFSLVDVITSSISESRSKTSDTALALTKILVIQLSLMMPIVVGLHQLAQPLITSLLGESWQPAVPILQGLALLSLLFSVGVTISTVLVAIGEVKAVFFLDLSTGAIVVLGISLLFGSSLGLEGFAQVRVALGIIVLLVFYVYVSQFLPVPQLRLLVSVLPAVASTFVMVLVIDFSKSIFSADSNLVQLLALSSIGALTYLSLILLFVRVLSRITPELGFANDLMRRIGGRAWRFITMQVNK